MSCRRAMTSLACVCNPRFCIVGRSLRQPCGQMEVSAEVPATPAHQQSDLNVWRTCVAEDGKVTSKVRRPYRIFCRLGTTSSVGGGGKKLELRIRIGGSV